MKTTTLSLLAMLTLALPSLAQKMTYDQAKQQLQPRELPAFWIGDAADLSAR